MGRTGKSRRLSAIVPKEVSRLPAATARGALLAFVAIVGTLSLVPSTAGGTGEGCPFDAVSVGASELAQGIRTLTGEALRSCAMRALATGRGEAEKVVAERAAQLLETGSQFDRMQAISLLGEARDQEYVPRIVGLLADEDVNVQHSAIDALTKLGDPRAVRPLAGLLRDPGLYQDAIGALRAIGGPEAANAFAYLARDKGVDIYRREEAVAALRFLGDARASAISREVESAARPPWGYLLSFPALILWLNWRAANADVTQGAKRRVLAYVAAAVSMVLVAPFWFRPGGRDLSQLFVALVLGLPLGTTALGIVLGLVLRGRRPELGTAFLRRLPLIPLAMWGSLVVSMVLFVIALLIGLGRVHA
jgi:HEAT repeats